MFDNIGFIGAGKLAAALAVALTSAGYRVKSVASRSLTSAEKLSSRVDGCKAETGCQAVVDTCNLIFITTPDDVIKTVADNLRWHSGQSVVHCSGADSSELLETARIYGSAVGVLHPLQTFAGGPDDPFAFHGITFCLEGSGALLVYLMRIVGGLGGNHIVLKPDEKALYHAAAVISCNYMVTLASVSAALWSKFGIDKKQAIIALLPLMKATLRNIERTGLPGCLTGPIARGDTGTVRKHIEALRKCGNSFEKVYCELGKLTLPIASSKGAISTHVATEMEKILTEGSLL